MFAKSVVLPVVVAALALSESAFTSASAVARAPRPESSFPNPIFQPRNVPSIPHDLYVRKREAGTLPAHFRKRAEDYQGTTEGSAAALNSSTEECTVYSLEEITSIESSFPGAWPTVPPTILAGDSEASAVMSAINASGIVPTGIPIRGAQPASISGIAIETGYDNSTDPDCYWTSSHCTEPKHTGLIRDVTTCPEPKTWGYTYDDGPNCTHNALYDFWEERNQKATVLYIGSNILDWPLEAQRGIADGHHVCVHTWSHPYMTALSDDEVFAELWYTAKIIKSVMGITPMCWRPPYGDVDDRVRAIAQALGLRTIMWDQDSNDWSLEPAGDITPAEMSATYSSLIAQATVQGKTQGTIVLEHEINGETMNFSMAEYDNVKAAWTNVVPLTACLNLTQPYGETDIIYPDFADYVAGTVMPSGLPGSTSIPISSIASLSLEGTMSGMGGEMPTATAGGPNNDAAVSGGSSATSTSSGSSSGGSDSSSSSSKSSSSGAASGMQFAAGGITLLVTLLAMLAIFL